MEEKKNKVRRGRKQKYSIADMQRFAAAKGGKCLSPEYTGAFHKLQWECKEGHTWVADASSIVHHDTWCAKCSRKASGDRKRGTLRQMQQLAETKGGKCLSDTYTHSKIKLQWQCAEGHVWSASSGNISNGAWCSKCSTKKRGCKTSTNLKTFQDIAISRGGKCLSLEYIRARTNLRWECAKGHQWMARPFAVKAGNWCPRCSSNGKRTVEDLQAFAEQHGGQCLSTEYVYDKPIRWKCSKGHPFERGIEILRSGRWCPACRKEQRKLAKEQPPIQ